ncbi:MAG: 50S ribosomal protein L17 [Planctomycetota bacterium]|nr:50S ribosomal protein L17 [Planctomycetota bacterium]MDA1179944.1 50S ribosomal protein L17 [Planctomycetota bacterium]
MRHRKRGRILGRSSSHRKAMMENMAASLLLTERDADEFDPNTPKVRGRIITTLHKAKEVRPLIERCITIARKSLVAKAAAEEFATKAKRGSEEWKVWRTSDKWKKWNAAIAPEVTARRRVFQVLRDKVAVRILFEKIAPRFESRPGGYTRIMRLATPRLGDAGERAILEFVGVRDRKTERSVRPAFDAEKATVS